MSVFFFGLLLSCLHLISSEYTRGEIGLCYQFKNRAFQSFCKVYSETEEQIKECVNCFNQLGNRQTPQGMTRCRKYVPKRYAYCTDLMKMTASVSWPELIFNVSRIYFRLAGFEGDACALLNKMPLEVMGAVLRKNMDATMNRLEDDQEIMDMGMDFMRIGFNFYDVYQPFEQFLKENKYELVSRLCRLPMNIGGDDQYEKPCRLCAFGAFKMDVPADEVVESEEEEEDD